MPEPIQQDIERLNRQFAQLHQQGCYEEAMGIGMLLSKLIYQHRGEEHPSFATSLSNLAAVCQLIGNYAEAEPLYRQAMEIQGRFLGKEHPSFATSLNNLALLYDTMGHYDKAEPLYQKALEIRRMALGEQHPDVAQSFHNLAALYKTTGRYAEAEPLYCQALEIQRQELGEENPDYAQSLNNLAGLYRVMGLYAKAEPHYQQALYIRRMALGNEHPDVATSLSNLGALYDSMGQYSVAEPLYRQALDIQRTIFGENHPDVAISLNNLGVLYGNVGKYAEAETFYRQALEVRRAVLGEQHADTIHTQNNLATLYSAMGNYNEAESQYNSVLDLRRAVLGEEHPDVATSLNHLATLYKTMGEYDKAEPLYLQSLKIQQTTLGDHHPDLAMSLNDLAGLYESLGQYAQVESFYLQALDIQRTTLGEHHPDVAGSLNNLAVLYKTTGKYAEAESKFTQALDILRTALGEEHPDVADTLNNLAVLHKTKGDYSKAESLYQQSLHIRHTELGERHPSVAESLNNLAELYHWQGNFSEAEKLYQQALEIQRAIFGDEHPDLTAGLNNLAVLEVSLGKPEEALQKMLEASDIDDHMISRVFSISDEKRIQNYIRTFQWNYSVLLSNFSQHYSELKSYTSRVFDVILKRKAIALELVTTRRDAILARKHPDLTSKLDELRNARIALARLLTEGRGDTPPEYYQQQVREREWQLEDLERELAAQVPQIELRQKLEHVTHEAIARLLPEGSSLVEFVWYRPYDFERHTFLSPRYLAFLLSDDIEEDIQMLDLGEASEIDELIAQYRKAVTTTFVLTEEAFDALREEHVPTNILERLHALQSQKFLGGEEEFLCAVEERIGEEDTVRYAHLLLKYADSSRENSRDIGVFGTQKELSKKYIPSSGRALYEKLFLPLVEKLNGITHLILSPDANITLLPFEILPQPNGSYVIENFDIHYVDSGRDLLRFEFRNDVQGDPLILADPDFDLQGSSSASDNDVMNEPQIQETLKRDIIAQVKPNLTEQEYENDSHRLKIFPQLSGTRKEADSIHPLFKDHVNVWLGKDALDGKLKAIQGPGLLHCATHGFFLPQKEHDDSGVFFDLEAAKAAKDTLFRKRVFANPLLFSGLALAGVHTFLQGKATAKYAEDGLLTALDVTGMDLIGTDLVVLSACVSGLGKMQPGEGVYGLRRAFTLAGARTQVLSLWSVPDEETKKLMVSFYKKILQGTKKATALREAQREMIASQREAKKSYPPYYWGAFVCVGDPGRLHRRHINDIQHTETFEADERILSDVPTGEADSVQRSVTARRKRWWQYWKS